MLFLDELPEFGRAVIEALREPLETGRIVIARAARSLEFPASFQLVAAMNPCPCGFLGDTVRECRCSPDQVRRYQERLSGPFLDRIDIRVEVPRTDIHLGANEAAEPSAVVALRVAAARERQGRRQGRSNGELAAAGVRDWCLPAPDGIRFLESAATRVHLSRRACDSVLRVARTIADLAGATAVAIPHLSEALALRRRLG